jgi:hypothetical protein
MPNPNKNETKDEFIARFMSDEEAIRDWPNAKQRRAVAESYWEYRNKSK